jgi:hypothetical protein
MRGGAQAHLMRCSDGNFYIVKFRNNPQHIRVLANEMLASMLARSLDLPVPSVSLVEVGEWLIDHTNELKVQLAHTAVRCQPGLQFGSQYAVNPMRGCVLDHLPPELLHRVKNLQTFAGMLAFDKWTGNADGRQVVFWKHAQQRKYTAAFIDQGYCFNAGKWTFPDYPLRGIYAANEVYEDVTGWHSFEPWISKIEEMAADNVWEIASQVPPEWYCGNIGEFEALVDRLIARRRSVRRLIEEFRQSPRRPFPKWVES